MFRRTQWKLDTNQIEIFSALPVISSFQESSHGDSTHLMTNDHSTNPSDGQWDLSSPEPAAKQRKQTCKMNVKQYIHIIQTHSNQPNLFFAMMDTNLLDKSAAKFLLTYLYFFVGFMLLPKCLCVQSFFFFPKSAPCAAVLQSNFPGCRKDQSHLKRTILRWMLWNPKVATKSLRNQTNYLTVVATKPELLRMSQLYKCDFILQAPWEEL